MNAEPKRLIDVLITHAMNWVNCECAFRILCNGLGGWNNRIAQLEAEINALKLTIDGSDIDYLVSDATAKLEPKLMVLDGLFASWHSADAVRESHKMQYQDCVGFCSDHYHVGYATYLVFFNAILLGMDPTHAEPFQALAMPLAAKRIRDIPDDAWASEQWATPVRPVMPGLRRVTPEHRDGFIPTVLVPNSTLLDRLQYDSDSPDLLAILAKALKRRRRRTHRGQ